MTIETIPIKVAKTPRPAFGLVEGPLKYPQHQNQQKGLDLYVRVINLDTGERCFKKLYQNTKGLHFKHTGYPPTYLDALTEDAKFVPWQVLFSDD